MDGDTLVGGYCVECGNPILKAKELFDDNVHCKCEISATDQESLRQGARYMEQSVERELRETLRLAGYDSESSPEPQMAAPVDETETGPDSEPMEAATFSDIDTTMLGPFQRAPVARSTMDERFISSRNTRRANPPRNFENLEEELRMAGANSTERSSTDSETQLEAEPSAPAGQEEDERRRRDLCITTGVPVADNEMTRQRAESKALISKLQSQVCQLMKDKHSSSKERLESHNAWAEMLKERNRIIEQKEEETTVIKKELTMAKQLKEPKPTPTEVDKTFVGVVSKDDIPANDLQKKVDSIFVKELHKQDIMERQMSTLSRNEALIDCRYNTTLMELNHPMKTQG